MDLKVLHQTIKGKMEAAVASENVAELKELIPDFQTALELAQSAQALFTKHGVAQ